MPRTVAAELSRVVTPVVAFVAPTAPGDEMTQRPTSRVRGVLGTMDSGRGHARVPGPTRPEPVPPTAAALASFPELAHVPMTAREQQVVAADPAAWREYCRRRKHIHRVHLPEWSAAEALGAIGAAFGPGGDGASQDAERDAFYYELLGAGDEDDVRAAVHDRMCQLEYARIDARLRIAFEDMRTGYYRQLTGWRFPGPDWRYYQYLRSGYVAAGVDDPVKFINGMEPDIRFLKKKVYCGVHPVFAEKLRRVEARLKREGVYEDVCRVFAGVMNFGGFVPRYISNKRDLSWHSLGIAIDIDGPANPYVIGKSARVVDDILDYMERTGQIRPTLRAGTRLSNEDPRSETSMTKDDRMREISDALQRFLKQWLPEVTGTSRSVPGTPPEDTLPIALAAELVDALGGEAEARRWMQRGVINLPPALVAALRTEMTRAGLDYTHGKDTMHFELLPEEVLP